MHKVKLHETAFMANRVKWKRCKLQVIVDFSARFGEKQLKFGHCQNIQWSIASENMLWSLLVNNHILYEKTQSNQHHDYKNNKRLQTLMTCRPSRPCSKPGKPPRRSQPFARWVLHGSRSLWRPWPPQEWWLQNWWNCFRQKDERWHPSTSLLDFSLQMYVQNNPTTLMFAGIQGSQWWSWNILIIYNWDSLPNSFWFIRRESRQLKNVQYAIQVSDCCDTETTLILTGFNAPERENRTSECFLFPTCDGQVEAEGWESPTAWVLKALGGTNHGVWTLHVFGPCRSATLLTHDSWFLPDLQGSIRKCTRAYWFLSICLSPGWLSSQYMISIDIMNIVHWPFTCKQMLEPRPTPLAWKMLMRFGPPGSLADRNLHQAVPEMARPNSDTYRMLNRKHFRNFAGKVKDNSWKGERQISQMQMAVWKT